jgi:hypothetical protein
MGKIRTQRDFPLLLLHSSTDRRGEVQRRELHAIMSKRPGKKGDVVQVTEDGGITKKVVEEGNGELIPNGVTAKVHYTGRLTNGHVFDSSHSRGRPFTFKIGA